MDNDPKGNDPVDRDPTNEEVVAYLHNGSRHWCPILLKQVGTRPSGFEFRTEFEGMTHHFEAMFMFVDLKDSKVMCTTTAEAFGKYPRANALKSLLHDKCFHDVEAFAVACRNALGDNITTFSLAGSIFVKGECIDKLLDALEAKFAAVCEKELVSPAVAALYEFAASHAEHKTDEKKELASPADGAQDKTDTKEPASPAEDKKELAEEVDKLKRQMDTLMQIVTILVESQLEIV